MPTLTAQCKAMHSELAAAGAISDVLKIRARALVGIKRAQRTINVELERGFATIAIRAAAKARALWLSNPGGLNKTAGWSLLANTAALERYLSEEPGVPTMKRAMLACASTRRANAGPGLPAFALDERFPDSGALANRLDRLD